MSEETNNTGEIPEEAFLKGSAAARAMDQKAVQRDRYGSPGVYAIVPKGIILEGQYATIAEAAEAALKELFDGQVVVHEELYVEKPEDD